MTITMSDRYELNAAIERMVGDDPGFAVGDAELLIARIPLMGKASPLILNVDSRSQGRSEGYSPGVGNVSLKDDEDRKITLGVPEPAWVGGYKGPSSFGVDRLHSRLDAFPLRSILGR